MKTPWRSGLYESLRTLKIQGRILDLGGSRKSGYHELIGGSPVFTVVNIDEGTGTDILHDIEKPLPVDTGTYDGVLLVNVLEHVFDHKKLLAESARVLKKGGMIVIGVPFLVQVHPSPHDYWRYTSETLQSLLFAAGFTDILVQPVGRGPFTASAQLLFNPLKVAPLRFIAIWGARILDGIASLFVPANKLRAPYPLGYFVTARRM